jgi:hypothetical protein
MKLPVMGRIFAGSWHEMLDLFHKHPSNASETPQVEHVIETAVNDVTKGPEEAKDALESEPVKADAPDAGHGGVSDVEAVTSAWTIKSLIAAYLLLVALFTTDDILIC